MAKQRANVPKFGNWENEQNVPYTVFFDKARQNKGGKMINPNDPQQNPEMFAHLEPSPLAAPPKSRTRPEEPTGRGAVRPAPEPRDGDFRQFNNSSSGNESNYGGRGQRPARSTRPSVGSELGLERSTHQPKPQPQPQPKVMGRGIGSPIWEGSRSHDSSHGTPSRSRLRPVRADQSPEKGAAVPKFGAWDENNPQSAENFTYVFNKVREERIPEGPKGPTFIPNINSYGQRSELSKKPKKKGCFPWW